MINREKQSYLVEAINEDKAQGTCGFVYEAGSKTYRLGKGNHIQLPRTLE